MKILFLSLLTLACSVGHCAKKKNRNASTDEIRFVPVERTPEPSNVKIQITFPERNQVLGGGSLDVQIYDEGYPVGTNSDFARADEIASNSRGESVRIIIDDMPYYGIYETTYNTLDRTDLYFVEILRTTISASLDSGMHVIRAFPVRAYGESLKGKNSFAAHVFYVGAAQSTMNVDLRKPFLTYNEPQGSFSYDPEKPILLDFWVANTRLSRDGYKVKVSVDGVDQQTITAWLPYYIYGLSRGTHTIQLQLLDPQNKVVPGDFNDVEKTITLY
ncbi:MAG TPA: hypothetical protein VLF61_00610 [Rhabdochlamydiaceae bacterium]|nr:hypothetical protein [Rhabdochlamydiaceae bacterium]